jgi:sugar/nucleoside kinase (ribokinase family)
MYSFSNSLIGLAPQGWLRRWDDSGLVSAQDWPKAEEYLRLAAAVFISEEDLLDGHMLADYRRWSRLLIMTQGADGCTVYFEDDVRQVPTQKVQVIDTTGAGDIFAAAFLVRLYQTGGHPYEAAHFANTAAAISIENAGLGSKMAAIHDHLAQQHPN